MNSEIKLPDDLFGRWWFEHDSEDSPGLLIVEHGGRAVQFHTMKRRLPKREVMRLWFTVANSTTIRFRPGPTGEGWPRTVRRTDSGYSIASEDKVFPMRAASDAELPDWFEEDYRAAADLMDAQEGAGAKQENQLGEHVAGGTGG
ncbi:MAG: hypothetical protein V4584_02940 [Verrucomicrobiota bacterium]